MKTLKLALATTLVTGAILGAYVESAKAIIINIPGMSASGSRYNSLETEYKFNLYLTTPNGENRVDEDGNLTNNTGRFTNAIDDFTGCIRDTDNKFKFNLVEVFTSSTCLDSNGEKISNPLTLTLNTKFLSTGSPIQLLDGSTVEPIEDFGETQALQNRIEYTLTGSELEAQGITELTLIIDGLENNIDEIQAVNSLEYIRNNSLFGKINKIRVSGKSEENLNKIVSNEEEICELQFSEEDSVCKVLVDTSKITKGTQIPESSPKNSLLALGFIGLALFYKHKTT